MRTTLTLHHSTLTSFERDRLIDLNERLCLYFKKVLTVRWVIDRVAKIYEVSVNVHARSGYYRARTSAIKAGEGIDVAFDRIVRQRRRKRAASITARSRRGIAAKQEVATMGAIVNSAEKDRRTAHMAESNAR